MRRFLSLTLLFIACSRLATAQPAAGPNLLSSSYIGTPITLEAGSDYNGFLKCAAALLKPDYLHDNNRAAWNNPLGKPAAKNTAVIAGHGHPGRVCTINGIDCDLPDQSINSGNFNNWSVFAAKWPQQFQSLTVLACDTGSGREGAHLVQQMADTAKMPVRAATGFIWCGEEKKKIVLDADAQWYEAAPGKSPDPIPAKQRVVEPMTPNATAVLELNGQPGKVPFSAAAIVNFSVRRFATAASLDINAQQAQSLIEKIDFSRPFRTKFIPDATVTAQFALTITAATGALTKRFAVLNDRLVNDIDDKQIYYRTSSSFTEQLQGLRRQ